MRSSRRMGWGVALAVCAVALGSWVSAQSEMTPPGPELSTRSAAVSRGEHMVKSMGCWDCHTPHKMGDEGPEPDMSMWLAGHPSGMELPTPPDPKGPWIASVAGTMTAWSGPWGISYTANLTPDPETGLGAWTEQQFIDALRTGRHQGRGRPILPPMPWPAISNLTDEELKAIFAYLRAIPPVKNRVPDPVIAAPPAPAAEQKTLSPEMQIAAAVLAAPADRRDGAKVLGFDASGALTKLRTGSNDLVCLANDPRREGFSVACYHRDLEPFMARGRELRGRGVAPDQLGPARWKEVEAGTLSMPREPRMLYVLSGTGFDPATGKVAGAYERWVVYTPFATAETTGLTTAPRPNAPWLMDAGTAGAHIMITPPRPK